MSCSYRDGYSFLGWSESASATTATYQPDETYTKDESITLYAVWKHNHIHNLTKTSARSATCTNSGNNEYWTCSGCGKYFSDANGTTVITENSWVIPAKGHTPASAVRENEVAATCTSAGSYEEVVYCSTCNTEISRTRTTISKRTHSLQEIPAKAATYTTDGNIQYWQCNTCKKYFSDSDGKTEIQLADTIIPKLEKLTQSITVKGSASSIAVGKTGTLQTTGAAGSVTYTSADETIAEVNKTTGVITAKKVGKVKITATAASTSEYKKGTKTVTIKVVPAATTSFKATNTASGIKLTWKKVDGATKYYIVRNGEALKTIGSGDTVTYTDKTANVNGTKYVYKITAYAATGKSTLSKSVTRYFVTQPTLSSATSTTAKKATIKWKKVAKTSGYQIQYSTSSTFASGKKTVTVGGGSTVSIVIGSMTSGKTYYIRIRTYKKVGTTTYYSAWSAKKSVKVK